MEWRDDDLPPQQLKRDDGSMMPEPLFIGTAEVAGSYRLPSQVAAWLVLHRLAIAENLRHSAAATSTEEHERLVARTQRNFEDLFLGPIGTAVDVAMRAAYRLALAQIESAGAPDMRSTAETLSATPPNAFSTVPKVDRDKLRAEVNGAFSDVLFPGRAAEVDPLRDAVLYLSLQPLARGPLYRRKTLREMTRLLKLSDSSQNFNTVTDRVNVAMRVLKALIRRVSGKPLPLRPTLDDVRRIVAQCVARWELVAADDGEIIDRHRVAPFISSPADREEIARLARLIAESDADTASNRR